MVNFIMMNLNESLKSLIYPGRAIFVGATSNYENLIICYILMGRSANSKNRKLIFKKQGLQVTQLSNKTKIQNEELVIYQPLIKFKNFIIIGNGNQTSTIFNGLIKNKTLVQTMQTRNFENDFPINTPRICALINLKLNSYEFAIVKKNGFNANSTLRCHYFYSSFTQNAGHLIHTYLGYEPNLVFNFTGEPKLVSINENLNVSLFHKQVWNSLNKNNKISLYSEFINLKTKKCFRKITNKIE